ncbi:hypothetical protein J3R30DRAFT_3681714 [Lentinula aciculospora]|uniref:K Homology domain-containing protein n=1 Tax=Lentinula aciculospora TaxID=153920 RepID=A0A9W9AH31_9AGAR|nr:hypothetical protein J3R30DRAFT_3681714 [Lentinula aciculospora]
MPLVFYSTTNLFNPTLSFFLASNPTFNMSTSLDVLSVKIDTLINTLSEVAVTLRSTTTTSTATPVPKKKGKKAAPTPAATSSAPVKAQLRLPTTSADLEKLTIQISVPDASAGHLVGRAGAGLQQIHNFSRARISVPPSGSSGARLVTIRGSRREVGDALVAIGKRLAGRRVRVNRPVKKTDTKGKAPALPPNPLPTPTGTRPSTTSVSVDIPLSSTVSSSRSTTPVPPEPTLVSTPVGTAQPTPMSVSVPTTLPTTAPTSRMDMSAFGHLFLWKLRERPDFGRWVVVPDHLGEVEDDEGEVKANSRTSCLVRG